MNKSAWEMKILLEKRKKYIWGTGKWGEYIVKQLKVDKGNPYGIAGILDTKKRDTFFCNLPVICPNEFSEWENSFIIVAVNNGYYEISEMLREKGRKKNIDWLHWQTINTKIILGISALYHDSAAALICNGEIIGAAQEERFTRKKQDASFPKNAIAYCLQEAGVGYDELDAVVYYDNPLLTTDRLMKNISAVGKKDIELADRKYHLIHICYHKTFQYT